MVETLRSPGNIFRISERLPIYITEESLDSIFDILSQSGYSRYGMEVGPSSMPLVLPRIDRNLPWIIAEQDREFFTDMAHIFERGHNYNNVSSRDIEHPIVLVNDSVSLGHMAEVDILTMKNPPHNRISLPHSDTLNGQRVVIYVSGYHVGEFSAYNNWLRKHGYPNLVRINPDETMELDLVDRMNSDSAFVMDFSS